MPSGAAVIRSAGACGVVWRACGVGRSSACTGGTSFSPIPRAPGSSARDGCALHG